MGLWITPQRDCISKFIIKNMQFNQIAKLYLIDNLELGLHSVNLGLIVMPLILAELDCGCSKRPFENYSY